jgi:hypothetical protein
MLRLERENVEESGWTSDEVDFTLGRESDEPSASTGNVASNGTRRLKRKVNPQCAKDENLSAVSKKIRQLEDDIETLLEQWKRTLP